MIDQACDQGWTLKRICGVLQVDTSRVWRWRRRAHAGEDRLVDQVTRAPVHGITSDEEAEILAVADAWKDIDRSHRKLAHRGSYQGRVWVSPSTFLRVLRAHDVDLPEPPPPAPRAPIKPVPSWVTWEPNSIWIYDVTHFGRAARAATAIEDVVSRKWLTTVLSVEETSTQIEVAFSQALEQEGLMDAIGDRLDGRIPPARQDGTHTPVLLAWSDNGPQMTSTHTSDFMALHLIAQHFGRPGIPEDQGWIESLNGHTKTEAPYLTRVVVQPGLGASLRYLDDGPPSPDPPRFLLSEDATRPRWLVVAGSRNESRELEEYARAFVGPSYGRMERVNSWPQDVARPAGVGHDVVIIEPIPDSAAHVERRVLALARLLAERPQRRAGGVRTLSQILSDLRVAMADRDREGAELLLAELESRNDITRSNLVFLRVQMLVG